MRAWQVPELGEPRDVLTLAEVPDPVFSGGMLGDGVRALRHHNHVKLRIGDTAPDFTLLAFDGKELKKVSLQDYRGKKNVALAFFVFAFTGG